MGDEDKQFEASQQKLEKARKEDNHKLKKIINDLNYKTINWEKISSRPDFLDNLNTYEQYEKYLRKGR